MAGTDVFAYGHARQLLELNTLVLCGPSAVRRAAHAGHLAATERRFYEEREAGIEDAVDWHEGLPPFVVSVENAAAYFERSTVLRDIAKHTAASLFRAPGIRRRLAALLRESADSCHVLA
jgi:hypothetical protein